MKDLHSFLGEAISARRLAELDAKGKGKEAREKAAADGQDAPASTQKALPTSALAIRKKEEKETERKALPGGAKEKAGPLAKRDDKGSDLVAKKREEKKKRETISNYMDTRDKEDNKEEEKEEEEEKKKDEKQEKKKQEVITRILYKKRKKGKMRRGGISSPFEKLGSVGTGPELGNISGGSRMIDRTKQS